jgi:hypothetical protein
MFETKKFNSVLRFLLSVGVSDHGFLLGIDGFSRIL